jgi:hypothetical protein
MPAYGWKLLAPEVGGLEAANASLVDHDGATDAGEEHCW